MAKRYIRGHQPEGNQLGQCIHCFEDVVLVSAYSGKWLIPPYVSYWRHRPRKQPQTDRDRRWCSKCGKPGEWYEFKPGSGECTECQT